MPAPKPARSGVLGPTIVVTRSAEAKRETEQRKSAAAMPSDFMNKIVAAPTGMWRPRRRGLLHRDSPAELRGLRQETLVDSLRFRFGEADIMGACVRGRDPLAGQIAGRREPKVRVWIGQNDGADGALPFAVSGRIG